MWIPLVSWPELVYCFIIKNLNMIKGKGLTMTKAVPCPLIISNAIFSHFWIFI